MIWGFRHKVDENCTLWGYYTVSSGNFLQKIWDNLSVLSSRVENPYRFFTSEDGINRLPCIVSKKLRCVITQQSAVFKSLYVPTYLNKYPLFKLLFDVSWLPYWREITNISQRRGCCWILINFLLLGWGIAALNSPVVPVNEHGALPEW
jgi:hypothetical protein